MAQQVGGVPELVDALRRRWLLALLVALPMLLGVVIYTQTLSDTYQAEAVVAFSPRPDVAVGGDTIRIVLPKYISSVTSAATIRSVASRTGLDAHTLAERRVLREKALEEAREWS